MCVDAEGEPGGDIMGYLNLGREVDISVRERERGPAATDAVLGSGGRWVPGRAERVMGSVAEERFYNEHVSDDVVPDNPAALGGRGGLLHRIDHVGEDEHGALVLQVVLLAEDVEELGAVFAGARHVAHERGVDGFRIHGAAVEPFLDAVHFGFLDQRGIFDLLAVAIEGSALPVLLEILVREEMGN